MGKAVKFFLMKNNFVVSSQGPFGFAQGDNLILSCRRPGRAGLRRNIAIMFVVFDSYHRKVDSNDSSQRPFGFAQGDSLILSC